VGISVTEDEADKKIRGARETRKEIVKKHTSSSHAADELNGRDLEINRTLLKDPNPEYAYRLVNRTKDGERISLLQGMGYETVPEDDETRLIMSSNKDGCQVQGDLVLMRTPIENYENRRASRRRRWESMSGERIEQAKENINQIARDGGLVGPHKNAALEE
jgi:hypothetical protein